MHTRGSGSLDATVMTPSFEAQGLEEDWCVEKERVRGEGDALSRLVGWERRNLVPGPLGKRVAFKCPLKVQLQVGACDSSVVTFRKQYANAGFARLPRMNLRKVISRHFIDSPKPLVTKAS